MGENETTQVKSRSTGLGDKEGEAHRLRCEQRKINLLKKKEEGHFVRLSEAHGQTAL